MRLLQRNLVSYIIYSVLIVLIAIPVFYFIINKMFLNDVDEALRHSEKHLVYQLNHASEQQILNWNDPDGNIKIISVSDSSKKDKIRTVSLYDSLMREKADFREMTSIVHIHDKPYKMILRMSLVDSEDLSQGIIITQIILLAALLIGLILLTLWQSKKTWKPFYETLNHLKSFELDKRSTLNLDKTNIREFEELNEAISQLIKRNYTVYLQQKEFTANAAHELQTPLAVMQAKLELMMQGKELSPEQVKHIQSLNQSITRMTKLNKGLLLLAKIENKQFTEIQEINVAALIKRSLEQANGHIRFKHLSVEESYQEIVIHSNVVLTDILISNLINNAILHTTENGSITVSTSIQDVEISNSGDPLPFPAENLFLRFQKGHYPNASGGNGLGLAIVKQICDSCHFSIRYRYENKRHYFTVRF